MAMTRPAAVRLLSTACLAGACLALAGCYQHVVGSSGQTSRNVTIQEANISKGDSVWSESKPKEVVPDRYSGTTLDRSQPVPSAKTRKPTDS